jgi:hypothetical protein
LSEQELQEYLSSPEGKEAQEYQKRIEAAARDGQKNGFYIRIGIPTGVKTYDPLDKIEKEEYEFNDNNKTRYYRRPMAAGDYRRYIQAKREMLNEPEDAKRKLIMVATYEFLALKYLGITHQEFDKCHFEDIVIAGLACDYITEWGGKLSTEPKQETTRKIIHEQEQTHGLLDLDQVKEIISSDPIPPKPAKTRKRPQSELPKTFERLDEKH